MDEDGEERKKESERKKDWLTWEKQKEKREKMLSGKVGSPSVSAHPLPSHRWGRIHSTLCTSVSALTSSTAQRGDLCLFPSRGIRRHIVWLLFLSSILIQHTGTVDLRHSMSNSYCSAWCVAWLVIMQRWGSKSWVRWSWPVSEPNWPHPSVNFSSPVMSALQVGSVRVNFYKVEFNWSKKSIIYV